MLIVKKQTERICSSCGYHHLESLVGWVTTCTNCESYLITDEEISAMDERDNFLGMID